MIISGEITQANQPSDPSGQFSVRYQDITITDNDGQEHYGRIGSKQGYAVGTPIQVTVEQKPGSEGVYNYFRKYNPKYPQDQAAQKGSFDGAGAYQPAPQQPRQAPSQAAQSSNTKEDVDWDAKDLRQARMNSLNNATRLICLLAEMTKNDASLNVDHVKGVASEFVDYIYSGLKKKPQGGDPNPEYCGEGGTGEPMPKDSIPF